MEIIYKANDGTLFDTLYDCEQYETDIKLNQIKGAYLFDENLNPLSISVSNFEKAAYLKIKDSETARIIRELVEDEFFPYDIPRQPGIYYYDYDNYEWANWEIKVEENNQFQKVNKILRG